MKQRDLDGIYCRIKRDGKFVNRCFTDLYSNEQNDFMERLDKEGLKRLLRHLSEQLVIVSYTCLHENEEWEIVGDIYGI